MIRERCSQQRAESQKNLSHTIKKRRQSNLVGVLVPIPNPQPVIFASEPEYYRPALGKLLLFASNTLFG